VSSIRATIINVRGLAVQNFDNRPHRRQNVQRLRHGLDYGKEFFGDDAAFIEILRSLSYLAISVSFSLDLLLTHGTLISA